MKRYLLIIFSLILFQVIEAQALISGVVKNAETMEPIQYVSVVLSSTFQGTSTDAEGRFTLEIPNYSADNKFTFQIVGYKNVEINLIKLMKDEIVLLELNEEQVGEVIINPVNAYSIVQKAT
ncbi:MAG: carboxypeptidase-like regulatory domain-containing protein, partial [Candidatus Paceibacterota bacterium]